jgi:hypothetical protein
VDYNTTTYNVVSTTIPDNLAETEIYDNSETVSRYRYCVAGCDCLLIAYTILAMVIAATTRYIPWLQRTYHNYPIHRNNVYVKA